MSINPSVQTLPAWISAGVRRIGPMAELPDAFGEAFGEVAEAVGRSGAAVIGPAYDQLAGAYGEFMPWLAEQKLTLAGHMFEFYDSDPQVDPAATVTRMVFPIIDQEPLS